MQPYRFFEAEEILAPGATFDLGKDHPAVTGVACGRLRGSRAEGGKAPAHPPGLARTVGYSHSTEAMSNLYKPITFV